MASAAKNSLYYGLGSIIRAMASFFLLPIYANILGASQYGTLNILQTFSAILAPIMTLCIEKSIYRLYFDYKSKEEKKKFLSTIFWAINFTGIIVLLTCISIGDKLAPLLGVEGIPSILIPVVIYTFLSALITFCQIILQTEQRGVFYFIISMLILIFYNTIALFLLFYWSPTYKSEIYANLIAFFLILPIALSIIKGKIAIYFNVDILRKTLKYTLPLFIMSMFSWILSASDRLFIVNLYDSSDVGLYSMAFKIVSAGVLLGGSIKQAFDPYFFDIANSHDCLQAKSRIKPVMDSMIFVTSVIFIAILVFGNFFIKVFLKDEFNACLPYLYFLVIASLFSQQATVLNVMILQEKKTRVLSLITIISGFISVLTNAFFIPILGPVMASVNSMAIGVLIFIVTWYFAKKNYYVPLDLGNILSIIPLVIICLFFDYNIDNIYISTLFKLLSVSLIILIFINKSIMSCPSVSVFYKRLINKFTNNN